MVFGIGHKKKQLEAEEQQRKIAEMKAVAKGGPIRKRRGENTLSDDKDDHTDPSNYINSGELDKIRDDLIQGHAGLVIQGMMNPEARKKLEDIIRKDHHTQTRGKEFLVEYITRETVGTGVIEDILKNDESITDIGYNGTDLIVESNDTKFIYTSDQSIDDNYIIRLVNKFANANGRDFTQKNPIFDGKYDNIRVNAMHTVNTTSGVTMSLRVVRPKLVLTEDTFDGFAPQYMYDFFESTVHAKSNYVLAGETGTGKTELQKLLASFIPFGQRIVLIEDVAETFLKEMFKDKDIYPWITSQDITITDLVKASLRNNPRWILVSETRGQEAYEMIQAVLSGHSIITTLHAINARAIPTRLINMAKMGYNFSEDALESDIRRYFDFGVHIIRREHEGKVLRFLSEIIYFNEVEDITIFKQDYVNGKFICQTGGLPEELKRKLKNAGVYPESFQEFQAHERKINVKRQKNDNGVIRLDLSILMGPAVPVEDLPSLVSEVIAVPSEAYLQEQAASVKPVKQRKIDPNQPVIDLSQSRDQAISDPRKPVKTATSEQAEAKALLATMKSKPRVKPTQVKPKQKPVVNDKVQSEAERLLAQHRKQKKASVK